jgi:DNA polymerase III subunit delta
MPFIVLHGADDFSSHEELARTLADERFAMNIERFDGATAEIAGIRSACESAPFLSEGRLVVIEGLPKAKREQGGSAEKASEMPQGGKGKKKKASAATQARNFTDAVAQLGATLPDTTTLIVYVAEDLPKTSVLLSAAQSHGKLLTFTTPTGAALERWIVQRAKRECVEIAPNAISLLASFSTGNLRFLANEINKLATYVGQGSTITDDAVRQLVADSREARVFDLTDMLARGDRAGALTLLHELLIDGQAPLMILGLVARQVRILVQVKDLITRGTRPAEIASIVGVPPFITEKTIAQARRFTLEQLVAALEACLSVDLTLKRSRLTPDLALDLLVAEFGQATTVE